MKTMDRKRFMQDDVTCAVSIHVRDGKCFLNDVMIDNKSGWCGDVEIYKNAQNITPLIRKYARDEENPKRLVRAPKLEISQEMNPADIIKELVQPFGKYADDPETKSEKYDGPAKEYLKHIWKKMYSEYVNKDSFETDVAFARQTFTCPHDITSDIFELMNYAREHGASDDQMLDTMLSE